LSEDRITLLDLANNLVLDAKVIIQTSTVLLLIGLWLIFQLWCQTIYVLVATCGRSLLRH